MLPRGQATATHGRPQRPVKRSLPSAPEAGPRIIVGNGAPTSSVGGSHDLYIDSSTNNFYGPKNPSTGWGSPLP